jgi:C-terminal processing protease CtpA/Prc
MKKLLFFTILFFVFFSSCKKEEPPVINNPELTPAMARDSLYYLMKQWYYWYDQMPVVTKENYDDPYELMDAMRYQPLDRWSFVADYNEFIAEMQGTFVGHGIRIGVDDSSKARIAMIYSKSPLYTQGVRRGWIIKKINNVDIAPILISGDAAAYNNVIGPSKAGVTNVFIFQKPDGTEVTISSTKSTFTVNSVLLYDTLNLSSGLAGHLVFESFIQPSSDELAIAFEFFKINNVKYLILDLRYNSGGYLYIAQTLASYIAGNSPATANTVFAKLQYNYLNNDQNTSYHYKFTSYPLDLSRLVVITTRLTASASEAVMNGLVPLMNVTSIGDTTNGKPVGMNGWEIGEKYFFWPVTFKMVNKNNEGEYFDGIVPAKVLTDDITHDFDDRNELCLKEAIHYLTTGSVSGKGTTSFKRNPLVSEKPSWMDNAFATKE